MIRPDNIHHAELERTVTRYVEGLNYFVESTTYHEVMRKEAAERLSLIDTPTALYVRGTADRVAVHRKADFVFMFEVKTNDGLHRNLAIEALPLIHHMMHDKLCLFVYKDFRDGFEGGFWTGNPPKFERLFIPDRWSEREACFFRNEIERTFQGIRVTFCGKTTNGSNDPFIVLPEHERCQLFDWRHEIDRITEDAVGHSPQRREAPLPRDVFVCNRHLQTTFPFTP